MHMRNHGPRPSYEQNQIAPSIDSIVLNSPYILSVSHISSHDIHTSKLNCSVAHVRGLLRPRKLISHNT